MCRPDAITLDDMRQIKGALHGRAVDPATGRVDLRCSHCASGCQHCLAACKGCPDTYCVECFDDPDCHDFEFCPYECRR